MTMSRTMNSEGPKNERVSLGSSSCHPIAPNGHGKFGNPLPRNFGALFHYRAEWDSGYSSLDCSRRGVSTGTMKLQRQENMYSSFPNPSLGKLTREGESRSWHRMIARAACAHVTPGLSPREIASLLTIRVLVSRSRGWFVTSISATCSEKVPEKLLAMRQYKADRWPLSAFRGQSDRGLVESSK
jgi:hypothetical protein